MSSVGAPPIEPARATIIGKNLDPWQPSIDERRSDNPQIMFGRNFRDRIDGPCSDWSNAFVNFNLWDANARRKISELRFPDDIFYGTPTGVYRLNSTSYIWELILGSPHITTPIANTFWPWTMALVGGVYYIAQYDIGLWQWDPDAQTLTEINTPSGSNIRYVLADHGRLVYFDSTVVAWSALDDGTDFIPDLSTGAGAQELSVIGGIALRLETFADGVVLYTTAGTIKGTFTTQAFVYSWPQVHSEVVKIFTPNSGVHIPQLGVVNIDQNGLWLTEEFNYTTLSQPKPWEIEKSSYIKNNIINSMNHMLYGTIQMYYSQALQCLFICFSDTITEGLFQTTFVYDIVSKRWSTFDKFHYGIFETHNDQTEVFTCSFMDTNGYMKAFSNTDFSETYPEGSLLISDFVYRPLQADAKTILTTDLLLNSGNPYYLGSTSINGSNRNPFFYRNFTASDLYEINDDDPYSDTNFPPGDPITDVSAVPIVGQTNIDMFVSGGVELQAVSYLVPETGLDSSIVIGPWRFNDGRSFAEETTALETVLIGTQASNGFIISEDWNFSSGAEDWNSLSGTEDWSAGSPILSNYDLSLLDANDAFTTPVQGLEFLPLYDDLNSTKLYKPMGFSSIYHSLQFDALEVGQSFAVKTVDITGSFTGVYQAG